MGSDVPTIRRTSEKSSQVQRYQKEAAVTALPVKRLLAT